MSAKGHKKKTSSKMKKILLTIATVLALTACSGGQPSPTGDAQKDAKAVIEFMLSEIDKCKTTDDLKQVESQFKSLNTEFDQYKKDHPEYKKELEKELKGHIFELMGAAMSKEKELKEAGK